MIAFFGKIFEPASVLWVCCISTAVYILLLKSQTIQNEAAVVRSLRIQLVVYTIISWVLPVAMAVIYLELGLLGEDQVR